jgi:type IV secretory pathway TraG/TraD family ATPase VirD4
MTTADKPREKSRAGRGILALTVAVVALGALALHLPGLAVLTLAVLVIVTVFAVRLRFWWVRYSSGGWIAARRRRAYQGWAGRRDIARVTASAHKLTRRLSPGTPLMVLGTRGRAGQRVAVHRENSALYIGPPGFQKTGALACHAADAPGPLFCTSTKTGLLLDTIGYRRWLGGRTWILNPDGYGGIPTTLSWSPLEGCMSAATAIRRAGDFVTASPRDKSGKDAWHEDRGARLLRYMLHAAAVAGASMLEAEAWVNDPLSTEPMSVLDAAGAEPGWAGKLAALLAESGENLGALISSASSALGWMDDPVMRAAACPLPGEGFSAYEFARSSDSVYLIGRNRAYGSIAPFNAALAAECFEQQKWYAMEDPSGRLPVPATYVLDEMPLTCPWAIHDILAESREYLITVTMGAQARSQLRAKWGEHDGDTIRTASPVEVIFGGEKHRGDLEDLSAVIDQRDTWADTRDSSGAKSRTPGAESLMPPGALRAMRKGRAVILLPECKPVLADLPAIWDRPGHQRADLGHATEILAGQPVITPARPLPPVAPAGPVPEITEEVPSWPEIASR